MDVDRLRGEERPSAPSWTTLSAPARVPLPEALDKQKVHFANIDGHLSSQKKCGARAKKIRSIKDESYSEGDIVKDDSGAYAVFTEQGSSASQMTARKVMDVIARLPDCDGQAADAVSAYTQVKMEDAPRLLRIPKSGCPDIWIRLPRLKWPKSLANIEDPVVPLERNLYGHPLAGLLWERQFEEVLLELGWGKVPNWNDNLVIENNENSYRYTWMIFKRRWKEAEYGSRETMILTNQLHFLLRNVWDALNVNVNRTKVLFKSTEKCSNPEFLLEQLKS